MGYNRTLNFRPLVNFFQKRNLHHPSGFTFIELIMVIVIIAVFSVGGAHFVAYLVQNSVFIPNQLNMNMLVAHALDSMIEGDGQAKGLRFSRVITEALTNKVTFINQSNQTMSYRLTATVLERSINGGAWQLMPYYQVAGISVTGKSNQLFTYYDAAQALTTNPANVRRIKTVLIAKTGSGSFEEWQGQSEQSSSIAVKKFQ